MPQKQGNFNKEKEEYFEAIQIHHRNPLVQPPNLSHEGYDVRIQAVRRQMGRTIADFCRRLGIAKSTLERYERSEKDSGNAPNIKLMIQLANEYDLDLMWLVSGVPYQNTLELLNLTGNELPQGMTKDQAIAMLTELIYLANSKIQRLSMSREAS